MTTLTNPPTAKPRTTSTSQQDQQWLANSNLPQEEQVNVLLDSAARQKCLQLGAALNSRVHQALLDLSRQVWELAQHYRQR